MHSTQTRTRPRTRMHPHRHTPTHNAHACTLMHPERSLATGTGTKKDTDLPNDSYRSWDRADQRDHIEPPGSRIQVPAPAASWPIVRELALHSATLQTFLPCGSDRSHARHLPSPRQTMRCGARCAWRSTEARRSFHRCSAVLSSVSCLKRGCSGLGKTTTGGGPLLRSVARERA